LNEDIISKIIKTNEEIARFWSNSSGWAPQEAADLLTKSRLDWQVELSKTLRLWDFQETRNGQLILAWANLGALVEGSLKLLLSVYYKTYQTSEHKYESKGKLIDPDGLMLEKLKQFYVKNNILKEEWINYIEFVQSRRNAIHAFRDRPLGDQFEFENSIETYLDLLLEIDGQLPYP